MERLALRVGEWAESMGISRSKAYEEIAAGRVPVIRIGKSVRVPVAGAKALVEKQIAESAA